jgi:pantoate--beta-alanine ligase
MQSSDSVSSLQKTISAWKKQGLTIGFVPTMGNLHKGHLELVKQAKTLTDKVVVSIFVNPLQFGENEDFASYPRTLETDKQKLIKINTDLLFIPQKNEVYPKNTKLPPAPSKLYDKLEGKNRPGHFAGVVQVVHRLFALVQPDLAIFGQKDYQQWLILKQMVEDLNLSIKMVCADIVRDKEGLALSSRNQYLSTEQNKIAPYLYKVLTNSKKNIAQDSLLILEQIAIKELLKKGFDKVDYYKILDAETLATADKKTTKLIVLVVARLGKTRLLDNLIL